MSKQFVNLTNEILSEVSGGVYTWTMNPLTSGGGGWGTPGIYPGWGGRGMSPGGNSFSWSVDAAGEFIRKIRP